MRKFYTTIFFLLAINFHPTLAQSQRKVLDSLKSEFNKTKDDKDRAAILYELVWNYVPVSMDLAIIFGEKE